MKTRIVLAALVAGLCVACASTSPRFAGHYDRVNHRYLNDTVGFHIAIPTRWAIYTQSRDFAMPLQLQPDQEQVLEAYDPASQLGLVLVVQDGPLLNIADLVQKMQTFPEERITDQLTAVNATDVQQLSVRTAVINGHEAAEWIYTATDTTGGLPVDVTVSFFILKVRERYVYITFSVPSPQYADVKPAIESVLRTFTLTGDA